MQKASNQLDSTALKYFRAVATAGSVRRAAEALNISPSALSRQVASLEQELGVPLFERLPRGLKLTSAGEVLLFYVEQSFRELERARKTITEMKGLRVGQINIALIETVARGLLPKVLSRFWDRYSDVRVTVQVAGSFEVLRLLERGEADIGICFNVPRQTELLVLDAARLRLGAVMSARHKLANASELRVQDLVGYPLFLADASLTLHDAIAEAQSTWPLDVRMVTNSITVMSTLCSVTDGIAFKTKVGVADEIERGELVFVPVVDRRLPVQQLSVVARPNLPFPGLANALSETFGSVLDEVRED